MPQNMEAPNNSIAYLLGRRGNYVAGSSHGSVHPQFFVSRILPRKALIRAAKTPPAAGSLCEMVQTSLKFLMDLFKNLRFSNNSIL
jgi:hypothetical protein